MHTKQKKKIVWKTEHGVGTLSSTPPIATAVIKFGNPWPLIIQNRRDDKNLQVLGLKYTFSVQICYGKMVYYRIDDYNASFGVRK